MLSGGRAGDAHSAAWCFFGTDGAKGWFEKGITT